MVTSAGILRQNTSPHTSSRRTDRRVVPDAVDATSPRRPVTEKPRAQVALTLSAAPKRIAALEVKLEEAEAEMERLDAEMMEAGADVERARELSEQRDAAQARADEYMDEWERLEAVLAAAAA